MSENYHDCGDFPAGSEPDQGPDLSGFPGTGPDWDPYWTPGLEAGVSGWDNWASDWGYDNGASSSFDWSPYEPGGSGWGDSYTTPSQFGLTSQQEDEEKRKRGEPTFWQTLGKAGKNALIKQVSSFSPAGLPVGRAITELVFGPPESDTSKELRFSGGTSLSGPLGSNYRGMDDINAMGFYAGAQNDPNRDRDRLVRLEDADPNSWINLPKPDQSRFQTPTERMIAEANRVFDDADKAERWTEPFQGEPVNAVVRAGPPQTFWDKMKKFLKDTGTRSAEDAVKSLLGGDSESQQREGDDGTSLMSMMAGLARPMPNETPEQKKKRLQMLFMVAQRIQAASAEHTPYQPTKKPESHPMPWKKDWLS